MRVLVVDDDELNRQIMSGLLARRQHEPILATNAEEALVLGRRERPDIAVTDVFMPGMDGFRLCMEWSADAALRPIPLVFYTSMFTSDADRALAIKLGARALLTKPMEPEALLDALEEAAVERRAHPREREPIDLEAYAERIVERLEAKVTELHEANLTLSQLTEIQSALVDCSPLGIALMEADCSVRLWSPAAERIFGWRSSDVVGLFNPLVHDDRNVADLLTGTLEGGRSIQDVEAVRKRADGTQMVVNISAAPVLGDDGEAKGILALFSDVTERRKAEETLDRAFADLERALEGTVQVIGRIVEKRDPYTAGHEQRVADVAVAIGERMGLAGESLRKLRIAGTVHDIGKIYVPAEILAKPTRLTPPEWEIIKVHPAVGAEILLAVDLGWPLTDIVLQHHERMDGSGYPAGLSGDEILLEARILAVADVVEAMSSHRPYRPALGLDEALSEIRSNRGRLYDADVVDACLEVAAEGTLAL